MNLIIDPEFSSLIPPLTDEEFAGLEKSIKEEGCRDALVVWNNDGKQILIDGHNRYRICQKHGIEFKTVEKKFDNREAAGVWMCDNQLQRRNISTLDRVTLEDRKKDFLAKIASKKRLEGNALGGKKSDTKSCPTSAQSRQQKRENSTDYKIAKAAGVSEDTVRKVRTINEKADDRTKELVRSGQLSINQAFNSVHPKRPDPVETAKKEHLEYEMRKAEKKVDIQSAQRDKTNQKVINSALMQDVLKLLSSIEKFSLEHDGLDMNILSQMVGSDFDRRALIDRCNRCRKVIFKIEEGIRE